MRMKQRREDMRTPIGEAIQARRLQLGWTQARVGEQFEVDQGRVSRWISRGERPDEELIPDLAAWLKMEEPEVQDLWHRSNRPMVDMPKQVRVAAARLEKDLERTNSSARTLFAMLDGGD
jgi:transcriptional regulator with XRE-family HTH domain